MTKTEIIQSIIHNLKQDLSQAIMAAEEAMKGATHTESKAETQYDTIGLEHAYLAEGQSRRIDELGAQITKLDNWKAPDFKPEQDIYLGALVGLVSIQGDKELNVFLAPAGGAQKVIEIKLQVITPETPLGQLLIGRGLGDTITLPNGDHYEIHSLC